MLGKIDPLIEPRFSMPQIYLVLSPNMHYGLHFLFEMELVSCTLVRFETYCGHQMDKNQVIYIINSSTNKNKINYLER
jgi:hypothetical protein